MTVINSRINTRSEEYQANADYMRGLVDELRTQVSQSALGGGQKSRDRHVGRGKLLPPRPGAGLA